MIFTAHTLVFHQHEAHSFAPGDTVPDWAKDKVGPHITADPEATPEPTEPAAETPADSDTDQTTAEEPGAEPTEEEHDDQAEDTDDDQPDFTQPAPRRRTSARRKG